MPGHVGSVDVEMFPDKVSAEWRQARDGTWRHMSTVLTGHRVLKSGNPGAQRAEWCPRGTDLPTELSDWERQHCPTP